LLSIYRVHEEPSTPAETASNAYSGDGCRYRSAESDACTGVRAFWHDERYARRSSVVAGVP